MASETTIAVRTDRLVKVFRDFWFRPVARAVDGLSLEIAKGEVFGLLGPNGSGKSTTVKTVLGLLKPTSGTVEVFGRPPRSAAARSRIGYLPELSHLHPFLTARECVMYYAGLCGLPRATAKERTAQLLEMCNLSSAAGRPVSGFSKGMARRVGIASALVGKPDVLVLDEPTSGLDPAGTRDVKTLVRMLSAAGVTILMTSHLLADVADVCDRIAILSRGRLAASGKVGELLAKQGEMQLSLPGTSPEEAAALAAELSARLGREVAASRPSVSLETFFLSTVSGGSRGFKAAPFLCE